jgi:hypothetical protein
MGAPHRSDPIQEQWLPQAHFASDRQYGAMPFGHRHLLPRALPQLNEGWSETKELLARWCQRGAGFIADENRSSKLLLEEAYSRADRCLSDIQAFGRLDETSGRNDLYKGSRKLDVHPSK